MAQDLGWNLLTDLRTELAGDAGTGQAQIPNSYLRSVSLGMD